MYTHKKFSKRLLFLRNETRLTLPRKIELFSRRNLIEVFILYIRYQALFKSVFAILMYNVFAKLFINLLKSLREYNMYIQYLHIIYFFYGNGDFIKATPHFDELCHLLLPILYSNVLFFTKLRTLNTVYFANIFKLFSSCFVLFFYLSLFLSTVFNTLNIKLRNSYE